jgi:hypothetical protein
MQLRYRVHFFTIFKFTDSLELLTEENKNLKKQIQKIETSHF